MKINIRKWQSIMIAGIVFLVLSGCSSDDSTPELQASTTFSLKSVSVNKFADNNQAATRSIPIQSKILREGMLSLSRIEEGKKTIWNVKHEYQDNKWLPESTAAFQEIELSEKPAHIVLFYPHHAMNGVIGDVPFDFTRVGDIPALKMYTKLYKRPEDAPCAGYVAADIYNPSPVQTLHQIYSMLSFRFVKQTSHEGEGNINQIGIDQQPTMNRGDNSGGDNGTVTKYIIMEDRYEIRSPLGWNTLEGLSFKSEGGDNNIANILLIPRNLSEIPVNNRQFNLKFWVDGIEDGIEYDAAIPFSSFQNELLPGVQYRFKVLIGETEVKVIPDDSVPVINDWNVGGEINPGEVESI